MSQDTITLEVAGAQVKLPTATLTSLWLERVRGTGPTRHQGLPKIGYSFPDVPGTYAGIVRGDGAFDADYHLVVLDGDREKVTWAEALEWAQSVGGELPKRKEQAVMFGNVPGLFAPAWYWSCEPHASTPEYAWVQHFSDGYQDDTHKGNRFRARAVRRVPI